jgi:hypothetical protein
VEVSCGKPPPKCIDIDRVARFLGVTIVYERIAEDDPDKIGFAADGNTALKVLRNGVKKAVIFPRDYVVLEQFLQHPEERSRCRFVKAHEISHILLRRADPTQNTACFNRLYDTERTYSMAELRDRWNLGECQANTMAAMLLMPRAVLTASVRRHMHRKKIPVYGDCVFLPEMKPAMQQMADELGVSYSSMLIQLKKYELLEQRDMPEYFRLMMKGGDGNE